MHDSRDRNPSPPLNNVLNRKRLGGYLVDAGLLTPAQVDVALNDQKLTGMRFGEILAARGWVKQQTIEYFMEKVILPDHEAAKQDQSSNAASRKNSADVQDGLAISAKVAPVSPSRGEASKQVMRLDTPIAKSLPPAGSSDGDVRWVG